MILRKPYAFFIRIFKPIHLLMAVLTTYLIFNTNNVLRFFSKYIHSNDNVVGQLLKEELIKQSLWLIPILLIVFSLIFLGIMFNKKKPIAFYIVTVFSFLVIIVITAYVSNFLGIMEKSIVSIKLVKLNHDLVLINMIIEILMFVLLMIRGLGLNFKKFNFDSDITKFDISESDKEEFELNIDVDLDTARRNRKRRLRHFKYFYSENRFIVNLFLGFFITIIAFSVLYFLVIAGDTKKEGVVYNQNEFNLRINKTILLNESFEGIKITNDYLIVVDTAFQSKLKNIKLDTKDFTLEVGDANFYPQTKYSDYLLDIGVLYNGNVLSNEFKNYIFVFEIPEKYIKSDLFFTYNDNGVDTKIKLKQKNITKKEGIIEKKINDTISFRESLGDVSFTVSSFDIRDKFLITYNYCVRNNECLSSKEYLKASINENFDKYVLKLEVDFKDNRETKVNNFYYFFNNFGSLYYRIGEVWHHQTSNFEQLTNKKTNDFNNVYIGVNSDIYIAEEIRLVFEIRGFRYEYILK